MSSPFKDKQGRIVATRVPLGPTLWLLAESLDVEHVDQDEPAALGMVGKLPGLPSDLAGTDLIHALDHQDLLGHAGTLVDALFDEFVAVLPPDGLAADAVVKVGRGWPAALRCSVQFVGRVEYRHDHSAVRKG